MHSNIDSYVKNHGSDKAYESFKKLYFTNNAYNLMLLNFGDFLIDNPHLKTREFRLSHQDKEGDFYQGEVSTRGRKDGRGIRITTDTGKILISHWKNDKEHGKATEIHEDGTVSRGEFWNGNKDGTWKIDI